MFLPFFEALRAHKVPVSLREYLAFLEGLSMGLVLYDVDGFYYFARAAMVKDERNLDKFDRAFGEAFGGLEAVGDDALFEALREAVDLPGDWLKKLAEKHLTAAEKAEIEALGGFETLMETLKKRLAEQEKRHQGGSKWIGTAGTSPFGAYGYNPEGVRIGQDESRHRRAVKVWDKRDFANLDDNVELGTRNIKLAMKRLRRWARDGAREELDLERTIRATAEQGYLDVKTRPERRNAVKVLLFLDVGGSMDDHVKVVEELFSAARAEFKHLEYFYFHNCLYEGVWRDNRRRWQEQTPTHEVLNTYGPDYKAIFVGDASMSPYEIAYAGGANEHWNPEPGQVWLDRARAQWPDHLWINPVPQNHWPHTRSISMISQIFEGRMVPMTLEGIERGMKELGR
ncbi:MAG TPA: VWA domain-containing protein [Rhodobacterales bacterium]|nr:VWA domain-containing protein [Rhodobacterales bacterium]